MSRKRLTKPQIARLVAFSNAWVHWSDTQRATIRRKAIRRLIDFWETGRDTDAWLNATDFTRDRSEARWIRRQARYLEAAGLMECRLVTCRHFEFRIIKRRTS